jgi:uncharacterized phage protein (TIGR01671 family)
MREIKFRGLAEGGIWIKGHLYEKWVSVKKIGVFIQFLGSNGCLIDYEVRRQTVGQYTGLKENGKGDEVYQHDLVKIFNRPFNLLGIYAVDWREVHGQWWLRSYRTDGSLGEWATPLMKAAASSYIEVIGNIHEEPEILNEETKSENIT